jgi:hypothetical protein
MIRPVPILWAFAGLVFTVAAAQAQGPMLTRMIGNREFQFAIVDGRLTFRDVMYGPRLPGSKIESLRTSLENGQPRLDYHWADKAGSLAVEISGHRQFAHLRYAPLGAAPLKPVEYTQADDERVALIVGTGDRKQVFRAADLWQLALAHPQECKQWLTPLLLRLRPGRSLTDMSDRIESKLLSLHSDEMAARRIRWAELVAQLGDDRFGKRQAADRALRAEGLALLGYLRRLDFRRLDAEQQFRVRRILESLGGHDDDSVEVAAITLAEEPMVWLVLLGRPEERARKAAARQLASLLGRRIDVDPAADPATQKENRERLRAIIAGASRD